MCLRINILSLCALGALCGESLRANPPVASYIFPAGGQRGTTVPVRVGGLFLHDRCGFDLPGKGVKATPELARTERLWFEGPLLPLPESQQAEDYPVDMLGRVELAKDAPVGPVRGRLVTSQGAAGGLVFVVGDLPEVVERETDGGPIPVPVTLPVTVNGRIFPREDVDLWQFRAAKGQSVAALVVAPSINSPLVPRLEILDAAGRVLAEQGPVPAAGSDASVRFVAPADGVYRVRITDARSQGGPAFVYRLTLTAGPVAETVFPLGGRRSEPTRFRLSGQGVPNEPVTEWLPAAGLVLHSFTVGGVATPPVPLDVDDLPEFTSPPRDPVKAPAVLNGRILTPGAAEVWPLALAKGQKYTFDLLARRLGSPLFASLTIADAAGKELAAAADGDPVLTFQPPAGGAYTVRVAERFRGRGGPAFAYRLKVTTPADRPPFRLSLPADVLGVLRGGSAKLRVIVERAPGFALPIELKVDGLPAGVTVKPLTLAANQQTVDLTFEAAKDAPVKAAAITITGTATVGGKPVTQRAAVRATRSLPAADTLLLAVGVPTPFRLVAEYVMTTAPRGGVYRRGYKLQRDAGFDGPVEVRLADRQARHLQGVTGPVVFIKPGETAVEYPATLPPWMEMGRTCRVCVMAVGKVKDADGREHAVSFSSVEQNFQMIVVVGPGRLAVEVGSPSVRVVPGGTVRLPVRVSRGKDLAGPVTVELLTPPHWKGVSAASVVIPADRGDGELLIRFEPGAGPFNMPATVRATAASVGDSATAEAAVEFVAP